MTPVSRIVVSGAQAREQRSGCLEILDELVASEEVREALAKDTGGRVELAQVACKAGFDPAEFGL